MVKFGKNKLKVLKKLTKKKDDPKSNITNKIIKKKVNAEKKISFQKEVLLKETVKSDALVKNINKTELELDQVANKPEKKKVAAQEKINKPKTKSVEKHKNRQKTQIDDTKSLLKLMKKRFNP